MAADPGENKTAIPETEKTCAEAGESSNKRGNGSI